MLVFTAKMHQIRFRLALYTQDLAELLAGAYSAPQPLALFKRPTSNGRKEKGREREGRGVSGVDRGKLRGVKSKA